MLGRERKYPHAWKDWRQKEKRVTEDEMVGRMASPILWTRTWTNFGRWWGTGKSSMLQSTGSQSQTQLGDWKTTWFWHNFSSSTVWILLLPSLPSLLSSLQVSFHISSAYRHVITVAHACVYRAWVSLLPLYVPPYRPCRSGSHHRAPPPLLLGTSAPPVLTHWGSGVMSFCCSEVGNIAVSMSCDFAPSLSEFWFPASSVPRT